MENIVIALGYIHPETKAWHYKAFADLVSARIALTSLAKRNIPVVYADFRNGRKRGFYGVTGKLGFYGVTEEVFIDTFIQCGGEYNIAEYSYRDDLIPEMIWDLIRSRAVNDTVAINGHTYTIEEDAFKQDEQWAEAYNSYSGFDKVLRWTVASTTDEAISVEFYTDL